MTADWQSASDQAFTVINSGEYALPAGGVYQTWWDSCYLYPESTPAFRYLFTVDGKDCSEMVFTAQNQTLEEGYTSYGSNMVTAFNTVRWLLDETGSQTMNGGWGLNMPTQSLVDAFAEESGDASDDPRFNVTVGMPGDSILMPGDPEDTWHAMSFDGNSFSKRASRKYECSPEEFWDQGNIISSPIHIPVIRYADVYLMAAEAEFMLNNTNTALELVNAVRERAAMSGSSGFPAQLGTLTFDDIVRERRLELALESHRFFDLIRWNYAHNSLNGIYIETHDLNATFEPGMDEFMPIPEGVIGEPDAVNTAQDLSVHIYPNPAVSSLRIEGLNTETQVVFMSITGCPVLETMAGPSGHSIDISKLPAGIYFIKLETRGQTLVRKIIKQ